MICLHIRAQCNLHRTLTCVTLSVGQASELGMVGSSFIQHRKSTLGSGGANSLAKHPLWVHNSKSIIELV